MGNGEEEKKVRRGEKADFRRLSGLPMSLPFIFLLLLFVWVFPPFFYSSSLYFHGSVILASFFSVVLVQFFSTIISAAFNSYAKLQGPPGSRRCSLLVALG